MWHLNGRKSRNTRLRCETTCVYKWVASKHAADTAAKVQKAVESRATTIEGWKAIGFPVRHPLRTFQAQQSNATFAIQIDNLESPVNSMMVLVRSTVIVFHGLIYKKRHNGYSDPFIFFILLTIRSTCAATV